MAYNGFFQIIPSNWLLPLSHVSHMQRFWVSPTPVPLWSYRPPITNRQAYTPQLGISSSDPMATIPSKHGLSIIVLVLIVIIVIIIIIITREMIYFLDGAQEWILPTPVLLPSYRPLITDQQAYLFQLSINSSNPKVMIPSKHGLSIVTLVLVLVLILIILLFLIIIKTGERAYFLDGFLLGPRVGPQSKLCNKNSYRRKLTLSKFLVSLFNQKFTPMIGCEISTYPSHPLIGLSSN